MKVFSFDAETDGLWGNAFSIAAIVYDGGKEKAKFLARLPDWFVTDNWVIENILPPMANIKVTHDTYESMLSDFAKFYLEHSAGATVICHMGFPVEANLLREMHRLQFIGDWEGPFPLIDIAANLLHVGENPTSVDAYVEKFNLPVSDYGTTHNPLYDSEVAAKVFFHLMGRTGSD